MINIDAIKFSQGSGQDFITAIADLSVTPSRKRILIVLLECIDLRIM